MSLRHTLNRLMKVVIEEAERNSDFEAALIDALGETSVKNKLSKEDVVTGPADFGDAKRGKNRRSPAVLDPVQLVRIDELTLRSALEKLSLEQLRDIVAEYGMDPARLVMKWTTPDRVINRIIEMSVTRAHKGNAFRKPPDEPQFTDTDQVSPSDTQLSGEPPAPS